MYNLAVTPVKNFVVYYIDECGEVCLPIAAHDHVTKEAAEAEAAQFNYLKGDITRNYYAGDLREMIKEF